jgi:hypothetical protein
MAQRIVLAPYVIPEVEAADVIEAAGGECGQDGSVVFPEGTRQVCDPEGRPVFILPGGETFVLGEGAGKLRFLDWLEDWIGEYQA